MGYLRDELLAHGARQQWRHYPNRELEDDPRIGGCAFLSGPQTLEILYYNGDSSGYALGKDRAAQDILSEALAQRRHIYRDMNLDQLGIWQQAAVRALQENTSAAELGLDLSAQDLDYVQFLMITLQRAPGDPLRTLAQRDWMLKPPESKTYTHPCPLCGAATLHMARYPRSVCDACRVRAADSAGRRIVGFNTDFSGGFVAHFADAEEQVCQEVTASNRCWIDGRPCSIDEARFGGVVIEALDT